MKHDMSGAIAPETISSQEGVISTTSCSDTDASDGSEDEKIYEVRVKLTKEEIKEMRKANKKMVKEEKAEKRKTKVKKHVKKRATRKKKP